MLIKTQGIVIKNTKYSESSLITKIYTRQLGMQSYIVNGIRSPKAAIKPSLMQPLVLLDMVVYHAPNRDIHRIKEVKSSPALSSLHFDVNKSAIGLFISELLYRTIAEEEQNERLFDFIWKFIITLDASEGSLSLYPLHFTVCFSSFLGFAPRNNYDAGCTYFNLLEGYFERDPGLEENTISEPDSGYLSRILNTGLQGIEQIHVPKASRIALINKMMDYYMRHIPNFYKLKSLQVLTNLMKED